MIVFDPTYLFISVADFAVISLYMIEHENAARQFKEQPKKPYAHHFDSMFFVIFFIVILVFAYFALLPAIFCWSMECIFPESDSSGVVTSAMR